MSASRVIEVLVEERSAAAFLEGVLPRVLPPQTRFKVRSFEGKHDLLQSLPSRLAGYAARRRDGEDVRVLLLVDRDNDDCQDLKRRLVSHAMTAGLTSGAAEPGAVLVARIAVAELEAWYFGDWAAARRAFTKLPAATPAAWRNPEHASGKPSHYFQSALRRAGYTGEVEKSKPTWGRKMGVLVDVRANRCPSFVAFVDGVRHLAVAQ
ncbi:MAG: DUF4276 family protein [Mycobacteriales bacterium]|nr:DUF4276 family protein [Mycobacteriales bacterium]